MSDFFVTPGNSNTYAESRCDNSAEFRKIDAYFFSILSLHPIFFAVFIYIGLYFVVQLHSPTGGPHGTSHGSHAPGSRPTALTSGSSSFAMSRPSSSPLRSAHPSRQSERKKIQRNYQNTDFFCAGSPIPTHCHFAQISAQICTNLSTQGGGIFFW